MLFNSFEFLLLYLPVVLFGYYRIGQWRGSLYACGWLVFCSLFFYAWWNPLYIALLAASILFNYSAGGLIHRQITAAGRRTWLVVGVVADLFLLAYYKYANFFVDNVALLAGADWQLETIVLPLGISFFTFTQIAYLVDVYRGIAVERNLTRYFLFVTYFPHLIAGPVLHHKEMMPQFATRTDFRIDYRHFSVGIGIFIIGLFKKVVLADGVAVYVGPVFAAAGDGNTIHFFEAWGAALCYTLQLYFDFSGYSDMAVGLSFLLGIRLPMNFFSPYKSRNIIEFWRRWHMTLSRFLRDYLYIPLGGNRHGEINRYKNLFLTMLLGGLWHGAAWTFVIWGAFHGILLAICHLWNGFVQGYRSFPLLGKLITPFAYTATFLLVVVGWVFFRATSFDAALVILQGMAGLNGILIDPEEGNAFALLLTLGLPVAYSEQAARFVDKDTLHWIVCLLLVVWCAPNVYQLTRSEQPVLDESHMLVDDHSAYALKLNWRWLVLLALLALAALLSLTNVSEFLYFQF